MSGTYFLQGFGANPTNARFTLAMLEQQLAELRKAGAPDDAEIIRTGPHAHNVFEIQWIGEPR